MSFQLAHPGPSGQAVPRIVQKPLAGGYAALEGALILADASDNFAECGADPTSIGAVAVSPGGTDASGFVRFGKKEFPPGFMQGIVWDPNYIFSARYIGGLPAANGANYGVVRDTDLYWKVDFTDTTATRCKLVDRRTTSPENIARVLVRPLVANAQLL
jgi:hypothetical protein